MWKKHERARKRHIISSNVVVYRSSERVAQGRGRASQPSTSERASTLSLAFFAAFFSAFSLAACLQVRAILVSGPIKADDAGNVYAERYRTQIRMRSADARYAQQHLTLTPFKSSIARVDNATVLKL